MVLRIPVCEKLARCGVEADEREEGSPHVGVSGAWGGVCTLLPRATACVVRAGGTKWVSFSKRCPPLCTARHARPQDHGECGRMHAACMHAEAACAVLQQQCKFQLNFNGNGIDGDARRCCMSHVQCQCQVRTMRLRGWCRHTGDGRNERERAKDRERAHGSYLEPMRQRVCEK